MLLKLVLMIICLLRGQTTASVTPVINKPPTDVHPFVSAAPAPPPNCPLSTSQYYVMSFILLFLSLYLISLVILRTDVHGRQ